jgi:hypothetical protein
MLSDQDYEQIRWFPSEAWRRGVSADFDFEAVASKLARDRSTTVTISELNRVQRCRAKLSQWQLVIGRNRTGAVPRLGSYVVEIAGIAGYRGLVAAGVVISRAMVPPTPRKR